MKLIDKATVVAEIEKLKEKYALCPTRNNYEDGLKEGRLIGYKDALYKINTLEVKEVDLKNELKEDWLFADKTEVDCLEGMCLTEDMFVSLAKKYFELGLSSQLSWQDVKRLSETGETFMNSEESDNLSEEEYYTEILNKFKAQKG